MLQPSLFESERLTLDDSIDLFRQSLLAYGADYRRWAVAFSGGKDSTTVLTLLLQLVSRGELPVRYEQITVMYANTRQELPMLHTAAQALLAEARERGCEVRMVEPPVEDRFFVRMLGLGYPPPHNGFRWCVGLLKINPMQAALRAVRDATGEKFLVLTGMRVGESAARDQRIALACSKNDGECSQGWFQQTTPAQVADVLAPALHFRVCHVADWLGLYAPSYGYPTIPVLEAYGAGIGDSEALKARTGCIRCPVAGHDTTLDRVIKTESWSYLAPFTRLWDIYATLTSRRSRLQKTGERLKDGRLSKNPMRGGPLTFKARLWGLEQITKLQAEVNDVARATGRPEVWLITEEDEAAIRDLIARKVWPQGWDGTEALGTTLVPLVLGEGIEQPLLGLMLEEAA